MEQPKATSTCKGEANLLPAIDDDSCDKEVSEITSRCRNEMEDIGGGSEDRGSSMMCEKDEESPILSLAPGSSQSSICVSCTNLQSDYSAYKNAIECNLGILKEKIVTTDELIKNYHKKCQENGKLLKKVEDLTEKLKKCYNETGALRVQLEKAKQANEPLKKAAARFEIEKNYSDHQALELKKKLRSTQAELDDLKLSAMAIDKKSTTIETSSKKLEKENETLNNRLAAKIKEIEKLKGSLKEVRAAKRKSEQGERNANRQLEKFSGQLTKGRERIAIVKETTKKVPQKKRKTKKVAPKKTDAYEKEWRKGPILRSSKSKTNPEESEINSESEKSETGITSDDETTDDDTNDQEVAAIFNTSNDKFAHDFLKDFAIPSPPLSPIPPSPAPRRSKVGQCKKRGAHHKETVDVDTDVCENKGDEMSEKSRLDINIAEEHLSSDEDSASDNQHLLIAENVRRRYLSDSGIAESNEIVRCTELGKRRSKSLNSLSLESDQVSASDFKPKLLPDIYGCKHKKDQIMELGDDVRPNAYATHVADGFGRSYSVCSSSSDDAGSRGDSQILGSISSDDDLDDNCDGYSSDNIDDCDNDQGDVSINNYDRDFTDFNPESSFGFDAEVLAMDVSNNVDQTVTNPDDIKGDANVCAGNVPSCEQMSVENSKVFRDAKIAVLREAPHKIVDTVCESSQSQQQHSPQGTPEHSPLGAPEHSPRTHPNVICIENQTASNSHSNELAGSEGTKTVEDATSFSVIEDVQTGVIIDTEDGEKRLASNFNAKQRPKLEDLSKCQDEMKTALEEQCESLHLVINAASAGTSTAKDEKFHGFDGNAVDNDKNHTVTIIQSAPESAKDRSRTENFESENDNNFSNEFNLQKSSDRSLEVSDNSLAFTCKPSEVKIITEIPNDIRKETAEEMQTITCLPSEKDMLETANSSHDRSLWKVDAIERSKETANVKSANVQEFDKRDSDMPSTGKNDSKNSSVDSSCAVATQSISTDQNIGHCESNEVTNSQRKSPAMSIKNAGQSLSVVDNMAQKSSNKVPKFEQINSNLIGDISVATANSPASDKASQDNREHLPHEVYEKPTKSRSAASAEVKSTSREEQQSKDSHLTCKQNDIGDRQRLAATCNNKSLENGAKSGGCRREVPNCNRLGASIIDEEKSTDKGTVPVVANIEKDILPATVAASPTMQHRATLVICSEDNRSALLVESNTENLIPSNNISFARPDDVKSTENEDSLGCLTRRITSANEIPHVASASTSSYSTACFHSIVHESPTINVPALSASIDDVSEEFSNELSIDTILSEETSTYSTLSPLPPTPPRHRLTPLLSPLPVTPLPDIVSPLLSPPELSSLPTFRESKMDGSASQSVDVAKPRAVLPTSSMRMLNFNSADRCQSSAEPQSSDENRVDYQDTSCSLTCLTTVKTVSFESEAVINNGRENAASSSREPLPKIETLLKIFDGIDGSRDRDDSSLINLAERNEVGVLVEDGKANVHRVISDKENIDRLLVSASYNNIDQSNCQISTKSLRSKTRGKNGKQRLEDDANEQCSEGGALTASDHNVEKMSPTKSSNKKRKASAILDESPTRSLRKRDENGHVVREDEPRRSRRLRGDDGVATPKNKSKNKWTSAISKNANKERSPVKVSQRTGYKCKTTTEDETVQAVTVNRTEKSKDSSSTLLPERTRGSRGKRKSETGSELKVKCLKSDDEESRTHVLNKSPDKRASSKFADVVRECITDQIEEKNIRIDANTNLKQDIESFPLDKEDALALREEKVASPDENVRTETTRQSCEADNSNRTPGIELESTTATSSSLSSDQGGNCKSLATPMDKSARVTDTEESSKCSSNDMSTLSKESSANLVKSPSSFITGNRQTSKKAGNKSCRNSCRKTVLLSVDEIPHAKGITKGSDCAEKCQMIENTNDKQPSDICEEMTTAIDNAVNRNSKKQTEMKPVVNTKSRKSAEDTVTTKPISGRNLKQSQVEYAQQCLESLKNISSPKEVVQNFSIFKNISSASSIVSAIISYLKVDSEGNMPNVYERLGCVFTAENCEITNVTPENSKSLNLTAGSSETMNATAGKTESTNVMLGSSETANLPQGSQNVGNALFDNSEPVDICGSFTKKPELTKLEQMILTVVAECAKVPHLGAVIKVLLSLLPKAILNESPLVEDKLLSLCRVYTALCRGKGEIERFKDFLVQFVSDINHAKNLPSVLITCYCIWPKFFCITKDKQEMNTDYVKENPVVNSIPVIATWLASENGQIKQEKALRRIFGSSVGGEDASEKLCDCLIECLKNADINTDSNLKGLSDEKQLLGSHANAVIQSLELISLHKGWEWCNDYLIADRLWSIFRNWSKQLTSNDVTVEDKVTDSTIASAIRLIGRVCQIGIKDGFEDFLTIIKMCSGILSRSSLCSEISLPVQIAAAHTLLDISSTDLNTISLSLNSWLEKAVVDIPEMLQRKVMSLKVPEEF